MATKASAQLTLLGVRGGTEQFIARRRQGPLHQGALIEGSSADSRHEPDSVWPKLTLRGSSGGVGGSGSAGSGLAGSSAK